MKRSSCSVADMMTTRRSGRRGSRSRMVISRKSEYRSRSCTSSTTMCVMAVRSGSPVIMRISTPVVQKISCVLGPRTFSSRMLKPTVSPSSSHLSKATRSASDTALMRRGCVTMTFAVGPISGSSRMNCGTCVLLPHPVSPETTTTWLERTSRHSSSALAYAGSRERVLVTEAYDGARFRASSAAACCAGVSAGPDRVTRWPRRDRVGPPPLGRFRLPAGTWSLSDGGNDRASCVSTASVSPCSAMRGTERSGAAPRFFRRTVK
mmetsp:Transcript_24228/g.84123  ORF Transcript_24228/g.84123 Transcript_24228/m.84123 type:complete len:264 (-) Transcript_24228:289-1080(-)